MDAEQLVAVGPAVDRLETGLLRQRAEFVDCVFVGILGVDQLAGAEMKMPVGGRHGLLGEALHIELHPPFCLAVERDMRKTIEIEIAAELAVDPRQQVQVERGVHAGLVVVSAVEDCRVLLQIGADQHLAARAEQLCPVREKFDDLLWLKIADCRAREKPDALAFRTG